MSNISCKNLPIYIVHILCCKDLSEIFAVEKTVTLEFIYYSVTSNVMSLMPFNIEYDSILQQFQNIYIYSMFTMALT